MAFIPPGIALLVAAAIVAPAHGADMCNATFDYPVQSHAAPGRLTMTDGALIVGATQPADYPFLSGSFGGMSGCSTQEGSAGGQYVNGTWQSDCGITGALATPLAALAFKADPNDFPAATQDFPSYSSGSDVACNGVVKLNPGNYGSGNWSGWSCQATLVSGKNYYFQTLSLAGGATLDFNGANVFVKTLTMQDSSKLLGMGKLHANRVTLSEGATLSNLAITVHDTLGVTVNKADQLVAARFQPHSLSSLTLGAQSEITLVNGQWAVRSLTMQNNSRIAFVDDGDAATAQLDIYALSMANQSGIDASGGAPAHLQLKLYQSMTMQDGAEVNGYVLAHYLNQLSLGGSHAVTLSLSGGEHWINKINISNGNLSVLVDEKSPARVYVNGDIALREQMSVNAGGAANRLLMYGFGKATLSGNAKLNAMLYVKTGNLDMSGQAVLTGAVSAVNVSMSGWGSKIIHVPFSGDWPGVCQPEGVTLHHFELDHSGAGLTCNPESVTIRACADAACTTLVTEPIGAQLSVTPASNGAWSGGGDVALSAGTALASLRGNQPGVLTIGVASSTLHAESATLCRAAGGTPSLAACDLSFADSGFVFDVQDTYANKPQQVLMKAVKKDDVSQQCVPGFADVSKPVSFWSDYIDPNGNTFGSKVTVNGRAVATSQGAAAPTELAFDAKGEVTLTVNYPDAGKMQLNARHEGSGESAGLVMTGADQFVSRPVGLCLRANEGNCPAGDASCPVFRKTGETFSLSVQGMAWESDHDADLCSGNGTTPNFELSNIALSSEVVAPADGVNGLVGVTSYDHKSALTSLNTINQSVDEVGVLRMTATPPELGYFGYTIPAAKSAPIGRFIPVDFDLSDGAITPACNTFTYMGQPFAAGYTLTARNHNEGTTLNYRGEFAKGSIVMVAADSQDGVDRSARVTALTSSEWVAGVARLDKEVANTRFERGSAPEDPLLQLDFGVRVDDQDGGLSLIVEPDMNAEQSGECQTKSNCDARKLGQQKLFYGRLKVATEQGVDSEPLSLKQEVEFYRGDWQLNELDYCTSLDLSGYEFSDPEQSYQAASQSLTFTNGSIGIGLGNNAPGASLAQVAAGLTRLHLGAPKQPLRVPYKVDLSQQPDQPLWLSDPDTLEGVAIFGNSRGNDRIIYRRESFR
ncbi:DUF6701 domain-containing protein [Aeromonas simiae]|uniref:MSHA biogenesis protein MshQ n=1 Tax=Aeromonas simiae TaxID=218936 RepID=A0A5J6WZC4_9GAMM|nr:DUF6701 domain-containing protein [Aeromonas simiae]QFI55850.1 MSHA biogenesis protein MshQ [Aeromonas simiae]